MSTKTPGEHSYPNQLAELKASIGGLSKLQPDAMKGFFALHKASISEGALDQKTKELIALAIAVSARCDGCIAFHTHDALRAGATKDEVADALGVAILMGGGPAMVYATHVIDAMEQF